ncbi:MAG TPA: hypothetical protein VKI44_35545 [Acetobacteraceae bacterium]|nr:hypothetical protein [Acetobacteraceae bacterium]
MVTVFSLGIDLGTSNSAIALADLETGESRIVEVTQVLGPNQYGERPTLPSALYIPHPDEFPPDSFPRPGTRKAKARSPASSRATEARWCPTVW